MRHCGLRVVPTNPMESCPSPLPRPGDVIADRYEIDLLIGEGGMGAVYSATNVATGTRVAVKWMHPRQAGDPDAIARFQREAKAAGRISHPNVVSVLDFGQDSGSWFMVMELLDGEPLSSVIEGSMLIPVADAVDMVLTALRGLAAAHAEGVVHRDLKPENIFLCRGEHGGFAQTKVLDFGVSKLLSSDPAELRLTQTGAVVGTPYYMSPEQVRGVKDLDERVDVYAMSVILYELLSGRPPFVADTYTALAVEIATGVAPNLCEVRPDVPADLADVIAMGMARSRKKRFPSVTDLAMALERFGTESFVKERPEWSRRVELLSGARGGRQERSGLVETATSPSVAPRPAEGPDWSGTQRRESIGVSSVRRSNVGLPVARATRAKVAAAALVSVFVAVSGAAFMWPAEAPTGVGGGALEEPVRVDSAEAPTPNSRRSVLAAEAPAADAPSHEPLLADTESSPTLDEGQDTPRSDASDSVPNVETDTEPTSATKVRPKRTRQSRRSPRHGRTRQDTKPPSGASSNVAASRASRAGGLSADDF